MNKQRWLKLCAAGLVLLPWGVMKAQSGSCGLPLPRNAYWISSAYGMRLHPLARVQRMHGGLDLASAKGTPVYAVKSGVVAFAGRCGCYGNLVVLRHPGDVLTLYAHLSRISPLLSAGASVVQGEIIGLVGETGCVTGPHLHFELRKAGQRLNPLLNCAALRASREVKPWHRS